MSSLNMTFRSLRRRKTRTALTVSGIVIGVAMILVLLSLAAGTSTLSNQLIRTLGGSDVTVVNATLPASGGIGSRAPADLRAIFGDTNTVNQSYAETIGNMTGVYAVSPQLSSIGYVRGLSVFLFGIDPSTYSKATGGLNIISGNTLSSGSVDQIVIGSTLAQRLSLSVGSIVTVGQNSTTGTSYTVVGIYSTGNAFLDRAGYVLLSNAQNMTGRQGLVTQIFVKASDPSRVQQIAAQISSTIPGVSTIVPSAAIQSASTLSSTLTTFFTVIGLVALLAGAFGVINTMMMSTSERTREIGTLRAIGATKGQIMKIFMGESFLIGLIGALVGVFIGIIVTFVFPLFTGAVGASAGGKGIGALFRGALSPVLTPYDLLISLSLGVLVGVLAGIYPAWRASKMDPVEALRHV
ncbi:MAG: ABC transporter permease [Nitrososphaerales archaeon]